MKLYSRTGQPYETSNPTEINRLKVAHGYSEKKPTPTQIAANTGEDADKAKPNSGKADDKSK